jgi:hypothetical protein
MPLPASPDLCKAIIRAGTDGIDARGQVQPKGRMIADELGEQSQIGLVNFC